MAGVVMVVVVVGVVEGGGVAGVIPLESSLAEDRRGRSLGLLVASHSSRREFHCMK